MNELEIKIIDELKYYHRGKEGAITFKRLAAALDVNERDLRSIVAALVTNGIAPLAGTSDAGYYFLANEEEFNHSQAEYTSRIDKLRERRDGQETAWNNYKQYELPKETEPKQLVML